MYHSILAFRGINKSTNIGARLLETTRYAGTVLAPGVIRGNATPPNMNRSLINVQAINRRIIVLGFAPVIIGKSGIPRNRNGTTPGGNYYVCFCSLCLRRNCASAEKGAVIFERPAHRSPLSNQSKLFFRLCFFFLRGEPA